MNLLRRRCAQAPVVQHPDIVDLEALRTGEGRPEDAHHVGTCAECRAILADLGRLRPALAGLFQNGLAVPREVDESILWLARKHALAARRRPYETWRRTGWIAAAAAVVVMGVSVMRSELSEPRRQHAGGAAQTRAAPVSSDINRDGRLDVLDAFVLARAVHSRSKDTPAAADLNGDGRIDQRDVDTLALRAVAL